MSDDLGEKLLALSCPVPVSDYPTILLGHGGGGRLSRCSSRGCSQPRSTTPRSPRCTTRRPGRPGRPARLLHRLLRGSPLLLSGRRHRLARRPRHRERPRDVRSAAARPLLGAHPRGGLPMEDLWRITRSMAEARGRRASPSSRETRRSSTAARETASSSTSPASASSPTASRSRRDGRVPAT